MNRLYSFSCLLKPQRRPTKGLPHEKKLTPVSPGSAVSDLPKPLKAQNAWTKADQSRAKRSQCQVRQGTRSRCPAKSGVAKSWTQQHAGATGGSMRKTNQKAPGSVRSSERYPVGRLTRRVGKRIQAHRSSFGAISAYARARGPSGAGKEVPKSFGDVCLCVCVSPKLLFLGGSLRKTRDHMI